MHAIHDFDDPRLDDYRNVPDAELLRARGIFVAEGRLVVQRLLTASRCEARSVLVTAAAYRSLADLLTTAPLPVYVVSRALVQAITGFNLHRGCLAIGARPAAAEWRPLAASAQRLVLLEGIANADNVGAIFRNAAAFGADAVLLDEASTDPLYRKAIRTSMGAALSLPFARLSPWPQSLAALRELGIVTIGLAPGAEHTMAAVAAGVGGRRVGLLLGHEGDGLSAAALRACDHLARIPMSPNVDSLNVATAAAIGLYEMRRHGTPDSVTND